ncbi:hypothetical protein [Maridesulfovibrio sp.]|uniref:hypothetical protein n=1 Tax=Maridesulfovibrio sp. TaxID=2795000 RepID=UPI002A18B8FE|nr:hypothetical protein [Maridesulfovibrio sp.]
MRRLIIIFTVFLFSVYPASSVFAEDLFVMSRDNDKIIMIDSQENNAVTPTREISGNVSTAISQGYGLFLRNDELFFSDEGDHTIKVYDANANGDVAPKRTITGVSGALRGLFVTDSEIFVASQSNMVRVFNINDNGAVGPKRTIQGGSTNLSDVQMCFVENGELYIVDYSKKAVIVFDSSANGNVAPKRTITSSDLGYSRGLWVDNGVVYVGDAQNDHILTFPASANGLTSPTTKINTTGINDPHSVIAKDGFIYVLNYLGDKAIRVFKTSDDGNVTPQRTITCTSFSGPTALAMSVGGYVKLSENQPSGVTVTLTSSTENATTASEFQAAFDVPSGFDLRAPMGKFTATVDSNGANGVFRFNSTSLNGTAGSLKLLKCFEENGTSMYFGSYSPAVDPETEGAWWIEDSSNNYIASDDTLTLGANYWVNYVVKDNGKYDSDRTLGAIKDPVAIGARAEANGCVMNPAGSIGLEWVLLGLSVLLSGVRAFCFRGK